MITKRLICKWGQSDNIGNGFTNYIHVCCNTRAESKESDSHQNWNFFSSLRRFCSKLKQNLTEIVRPFQKWEAKFLSYILPLTLNNYPRMLVDMCTVPFIVCTSTLAQFKFFWPTSINLWKWEKGSFLMRNSQRFFIKAALRLRLDHFHQNKKQTLIYGILFRVCIKTIVLHFHHKIG